MGKPRTRRLHDGQPDCFQRGGGIHRGGDEWGLADDAYHQECTWQDGIGCLHQRTCAIYRQELPHHC